MNHDKSLTQQALICLGLIATLGAPSAFAADHGRNGLTAVPNAATTAAPPSVSNVLVVAYSGGTTSGTLTGTDPSGTLLVYAITTQPPNGKAVLTDPVQGTFTYTSNPGFIGLDTFTYKATDQLFLVGNAEVQMQVLPPPVAEGETVYVYAGETITGTLPAADAASASLTGTITKSSSAEGTASVSANTFTYQANSGGQGQDQFAYTVSNGSVSSTPATITVIVSSDGPSTASDSPIASNLSLPTYQEIPVNGAFMGTSATGAALTYNVISEPKNGTLSFTPGASASFTYTPGSGYTGPDQFTYSVTDGTFTSGVATVKIDVLPNDATPPNNKNGGGGVSIGVLFSLLAFLAIRRHRGSAHLRPV